MALFRKSEENKPSVSQDLQDLRRQIDQSRLSPPVAAVALKELERLEKTDPSAAEYAIGVNYIDFKPGSNAATLKLIRREDVKRKSVLCRDHAIDLNYAVCCFKGECLRPHTKEEQCKT